MAIRFVIDLNVNVNLPKQNEVPAWAKAIADKLDLIISKENTIMADLDQAISEVQAQSTQIAGVQTLITQVEQQLADALSGATLPPAVQAKVDAVFAGLQTNSAALATALATQPGGQPAPVGG